LGALASVLSDEIDLAAYRLQIFQKSDEDRCRDIYREFSVE
jgi:hypothetical protein